jgi:hypothetical protein
MKTLSKLALGKIGETLVELELERRGWMVFIPHYEEGINFVAVKKQIMNSSMLVFRLSLRDLCTLRVKLTELQ